MSELQRFPQGNLTIGTYGNRLRHRLDPQDPSNKSFGSPKIPPPSEEVVERQFQERLTGGYQRYTTEMVGRKKVRKSNRCDQCFQLRSANGTCGCEE